MEITTNGKIICLFELSTSILIYDKNCNYISQLIPNRSKQEIINIFKWSQNQKTLGAVSQNGISFWSEKQDFKFGYQIDDCQIDLIHYLQSLDMWIVIEYKTGKIFEFSLQKQKRLDQFINKKLSAAIVTYKPQVFVEVKYANLFGIVVGNQIHFIHFKKRQVIAKISISTIIRSLSYSDSYHLLFICGYDTKVSIYELNLCFCDFDSKQSSIESKGLISHCLVKPESPTLVTYDDLRFIRLWNIKTMQCYQFINVQVQVKALLITSDRVIIGGHHLAHCQFQQTSKPIRQTIKCLSLSEERIYVCTSNSIKYYNWNDGKLQRVVEGVFKNEQIVHVSIDSNKGEIILMGDLGSIQIRAVSSSQIIFEMRRQPSIIYKYDQNNGTLFQFNTKLSISFLQSSIKTVRVLKAEIKVLAISSFAGLLAFYYQSKIYVIKYSTMVLTHLIQIPTSYELLDLLFVQGTNSIILMSKYRFDLLVLTSQGKYIEAYRVQYNIPMKDSPQVFASPLLFFDKKVLQQMSIFLGTTNGWIYNIELKNLRISMCQLKMMQTIQSLKYKEIITNVSSLSFDYPYQKIYLEKIRRSQVQKLKSQVQTKLKSIRSLILQEKLVASNITKIMIYSKQLNLLGQIDIAHSYPTKWFDMVQKNQFQDYAQKLLRHLGHKSNKQKSTQEKSYITKQQLEEKKQQRQNLFKSKSKTKAFKKETEQLITKTKSIASFIRKSSLRMQTEPTIQEQTFSRQRITSQNLTNTLSRTIQSSRQFRKQKLLLDMKPRSTVGMVSALDFKLKSSQTGRRIMTEPRQRFPSISSRLKRD